MSVWERVVGQPAVVHELALAAKVAAGGAGPETAMTHAWLITGPPGSGRSIAAESFAAALVCRHGGCGQCPDCREALAGTHPDVDLVRSTLLSHGKQQTRELVVRAAGAPVAGLRRCLVVEDADRMTEAAANTLLKAIEEPTERTVWILCAPSSEDLLPTIRSRARLVNLRVPAREHVAAHLVAEGVDPAMASFAAAASQGHIGRARALALQEEVRSRRLEILHLPLRLSGLGDAYRLADEWVRAAEDDAQQRASQEAEAENSEMMAAYGEGASGVSAGRVRALARGAISELARTQKLRTSRSARDELDRGFVDLLGFYRDVLVLQTGAASGLINPDLRVEIERLAAAGDAVTTLRRLAALSAARSQLAGNVPPKVVCEALLVQLLHPVTPRTPTASVASA